MNNVDDTNIRDLGILGLMKTTFFKFIIRGTGTDLDIYNNIFITF